MRAPTPTDLICAITSTCDTRLSAARRGLEWAQIEREDEGVGSSSWYRLCLWLDGAIAVLNAERLARLREENDVPPSTLDPLEMPARCHTCLANADITLDRLVVLTDAELLRIKGIGPGMLAAIREALASPHNRNALAAVRRSG